MPWFPVHGLVWTFGMIHGLKVMVVMLLLHRPLVLLFLWYYPILSYYDL